ncbi:MAG TPA: hypothetical protein DD435_01260 [Cyanobacteria bacterium UBA8530]|nr:hypothetical protein [Cyanobacteria bacterium UBA8530]
MNNSQAVVATGTPNKTNSQAVVVTGSPKKTNSHAIVKTGSPKKINTQAVVATGSAQKINTQTVATGSAQKINTQTVATGSAQKIDTPAVGVNGNLIVFTVLVALVIALGVFIVLRPQYIKNLWNRIAQFLGKSVERRFFGQFKKKYPEIAERFEGYGTPTTEKQENLMAAFKRLPPIEAKKLHDEFQRLKTNFLVRHPEVEGLLGSAQGGDAKAQLKAMEALLKLPDDQRKSLSKDFLWAWDQLRTRFPRLMGSLEAAYKKG